jgi:hypothetical protein
MHRTAIMRASPEATPACSSASRSLASSMM